MLLANYNSDSGSESESETPGPSRSSPKKTAPPPPARPAQTNSTSTKPGPSSAAAGAVKAKRKGPVKITLDLPKDGKTTREDLNGSDGDVDEGQESKRPKLGLKAKGKGSSALLGMLPPPKRKTPGTKPGALGSASGSGGGGTRSGLSVNRSMARPHIPAPVGGADLSGILGPGADAHTNANPDADADADADDDGEDRQGNGLMVPASIARGKAKAKSTAEEPGLDLFGLASTSTSTLPPSKPPSTTTPKPPSISSAPSAPDFIPPPPTPSDPYPGYYQTPLGEWKAYDPEYYASFFSSSDAGPALQGEKGDDGRVGHHWDEFDTQGAHVVDVDVSASVQKAREEEERKKLVKRPTMPGDDFEYKAIGQIKGVAAQRHQLTSLLHTAYTSREELEERIAQNKKNMRLAGQKYGF